MHANEALARSEMAAAVRGDLDAMLDHYTDDVTFHYPGRNVLSGTYRGKDGIRNWVERISELLGAQGSLTRTIRDILASDEHVIQLIAVEARRADGCSASWNAAVVMRVREGKISEIRLHLDDPYVVDGLFNGEPGA